MNSKEHYIGIEGKNSRGYYRTNLSDEEKIGYVKEVIRKELINNELYGKKSIDTHLFNKCSRDFIETENGRFVHNVKSEVTSFEVNHLKNQNTLLRQLISELSHENSVLKGKLLRDGGNTKILNG